MSGHTPAQARMSHGAHAAEAPVMLQRYLDVVVLVVAAPIVLLLGAPALGYGVAAGAWIALRAVGVAVERHAESAPTATGGVGIRLGFLLARLFLLALAVILVRSQAGRDQGLTALAVLVVAYTISLVTSFADRPRRR